MKQDSIFLQNITQPQQQTFSSEYQFYILIVTLLINTLISLITPLISAAILVIKRIEKSKCCGGELVLKPNTPLPNTSPSIHQFENETDKTL